jgi:hypothetical protein
MRIESFTAFDYIVSVVSRTAGDKYAVIIGREKSREEFGVYTVYTKGLIKGMEVRTNTPILDRTVGTFSANLNTAPAGRYFFTVIEDSESFCIDRVANKQRFPSRVRLLDIKEGESTQLEDGLQVLVCIGTGAHGTLKLEPKTSFINDGTKTITATTRILAMIIED